MAQTIQLKHKISGVLKEGFYGFSWTTFFFGPFVALFRADFVTFLGYLLIAGFIGLITAGVGAFFTFIIWAFFYNGYYTKRLLEKGYAFSDTQYKNEEAARVLGVAIETETNSIKQDVTNRVSNLPRAYSSFSGGDKTLANDAYKIYLVKKYPIEFNDVLKKYIFNDKLFDSADDALVAVMEVENSTPYTTSTVGAKVCYTSKSEAISFLGLMGVDVQDSMSGKITVTDKVSTQYFYSDSEFLDFANKRGN